MNEMVHLVATSLDAVLSVSMFRVFIGAFVLADAFILLRDMFRAGKA